VKLHVPGLQRGDALVDSVLTSLRQSLDQTERSRPSGHDVAGPNQQRGNGVPEELRAMRASNRDIPRAADGSLPDVWLIVEWPPGADEPTKYWLSNLDTRTPVKTLVRLAKIRWRVEHDYRELKTGLGIDHFEGRSFVGWHRHVTLTVLAQAFCTLLRLDPKAAAPA
jgi:SRSO17 transposase